MTRCAAPSWGAEPMRSFPMLPAVLLSTLPAMAAATEWSCLFQTECVDGDCAGSGYEASVTLGPDGTTATLSDPSEDVSLTGSATGAAVSLAAPNRLLTVDAAGDARYTTHFDDPAMAITYLGRCEEAG